MTSRSGSLLVLALTGCAQHPPEPAVSPEPEPSVAPVDSNTSVESPEDSGRALSAACAEVLRLAAVTVVAQQSRPVMVRASTPDRLRGAATSLREVKLQLGADNPARDFRAFVDLNATTDALAAALDDVAASIETRAPSQYATARDRVDAFHREHGQRLAGAVKTCKELLTPEQTQKVTISSGHLSKEAIVETVRAHFPVFQSCYDKARRNNPSLSGRVVARFIVDEDGTVPTVTINERLVPNGPEEESALEFLKQQNRGLPALQGHGTTLPDDAAALCIGQAYYQLQFPRPERGKATVVYPIVFAPNQSGPDDTAPDDDPSKGAPRQWTRSDQSDRK